MRFTNCVSNQPAARCGARATTLGVSLTPLLMTLAHAADFGPVIEKPAFVIPGTQAGHFGASVSTAGDVNGDGFSDLLVGEPAYSNGQNGEGRALLFLGSASGMSPFPSWTFEGNQAQAALGSAVATAGDVDGDGFDDVLIGIPHFENGQRGEGRALLFKGSSSGLTPTPAWSIELDLEFAAFGASVSTAGDIDGEGFADVLIGAPNASLGAPRCGVVILYRGGTQGLATTGTALTPPPIAELQFGASLASAGDLEGDGFADVLIGAPGFDLPGLPDCGASYVYRGFSGGIAFTPLHSFFGETAGAHFGTSVSLVGDANGDGRSDCLFGAPGAGSSRQGHALYFETDVSGSPILERTFVGEQPFGRFGAAVATAGDLNGDGRADAIVGAPNQDHDGLVACGAAHVFLGLAKGLIETNSLPLFGESLSGAFGSAVATAGDSDGNGYSDLAIGAPDAKFGKGAVYGFRGAGGLASQAPTKMLIGQQAEDNAYSLSLRGDFDGDGFSDLLAGAHLKWAGTTGKSGRALVRRGSPTGLETIPSWQVIGAGLNIYFAYRVECAGDVNGDGYDDALVGDIFYSQGQADEGAVYLFLGSNQGLSTTPAWIAQSNEQHGVAGQIVEGVGDVNADGFVDFVIDVPSGPFAPKNSLVLGSVSGGDPSAMLPFQYQLAGATIGASSFVAGARDTDGDGFDDVVVGLNEQNGFGSIQGWVLTLRGHGAGLDSIPSWVVGPVGTGPFGTFYGATSGDFDSDGFSDLVVASPFALDSALKLYKGSQGGPAGTPSWMYYDTLSETAGSDICNIGDCDGDGFEDFAFSCPNYSVAVGTAGRVRLMRGASGGPTGEPPWTFLTNNFGSSIRLSGGGDVNGDGFSDFVIDELGYYDSSSTNVGRIDLFLGNGALGDGSGAGVARGLSQRRVVDPTRIGPNQISDSSSSFVTTALGRSAAGRVGVALEVEVEPAGTAFDGQGLLSSPWLSTGAPATSSQIGSAVPVTFTIANLPASSRFHWRQRTRTRNPFFPSSPWFSILNRGIEETHVRTR